MDRFKLILLSWTIEESDSPQILEACVLHISICHLKDHTTIPKRHHINIKLHSNLWHVFEQKMLF